MISLLVSFQGIRDDIKISYMTRSYDSHSPGIYSLYNGFTVSPWSHDVWVEYSSLDVRVGQQVPLVDKHTFLSEVGGGLGLFLGFSIIETMMVIYRVILRKQWPASPN